MGTRCCDCSHSTILSQSIPSPSQKWREKNRGKNQYLRISVRLLELQSPDRSTFLDPISFL